MKKSIAILYCLTCASLLSAQLPPLQQKAIQIKRMIELNHYSPPPVNDSFSISFFRSIINTIDSRRLLFTAAEYKTLETYCLKLDDELQGNGWKFLDLLTSLYKRSLTRADSILNASFQKPFDFTANESLATSNEITYKFAANPAELNSRWTRYLKFIALARLYDIISGDSVNNVFSKEALAKLEPSVRNKIRATESKDIKRLLSPAGGFEKNLAGLYFNAIAVSFDPHTNYFPPEAKEDFQSALSSEGLSYGLEFYENDKGKIVVDHLVPGGPAWKSGELHKGDELLKINFENKTPEDATELSLEKVYEMLEQPESERLIIKVKKANGEQKTVTLRKEKISNEENIVRSFVLQGEKKIGYILLPGFYTEWDNESGSGCANDVAKEVIKLKKEKIDGLIIDVRFNGGGSMGEGLEMTGVFVDEGPLAGEKNAKGKVSFYKDPNRGLIYDGPLVLMVNGQSASASEMLAGSLQDYNRALIVGSTTYGKASVQRLFPVDTTFNPNSKMKRDATDVLKITIGKFYRLSGLSSQLKGVKPDVVLPDAFDIMNIGERSYNNALASDSIQKNAYYKPLSSFPVSELARKSSERIRTDAEFQLIQNTLKTRGQPGQEIIPLKWDSFEEWANQQAPDVDLPDADKPIGRKYRVANNTLDLQWIQSSEYETDLNKNWLKNIGEDIYIGEAFFVICDLINLQKPPSKN